MTDASGDPRRPHRGPQRLPSPRRCGKPHCGEAAAASLSFQYEARVVHLLDLTEPHPSRYDLCGDHADGFVVPNGWELLDDRAGEPVVAEELDAVAEAGGPGPGTVGGERAAGGNRYAALSARLPQLAAEVAGRDAPAGPEPVASRDLSPMPIDPSPGVDDDDAAVVLSFERPSRQRNAAADDAAPSDADAAEVDAADAAEVDAADAAEVDAADAAVHEAGEAGGADPDLAAHADDDAAASQAHRDLPAHDHPDPDGT